MKTSEIICPTRPILSALILCRRALFSLSLIAAAGCMVGPDYSPPSLELSGKYNELTGDLTAPSAALIDETRWWRRFDDSELASLVERAVAANNTMKVAEARMRQARAAREEAQSLLYPQFSLNASALRFKASKSLIGIPGVSLEDSLFTVGFDASWLVDVFGGTRRLIESSEAQEETVAAVRRGVFLMVAGETARAYIELRGAQRQLQVARDTLRDQRGTLSLTETKWNTGLASNLEVARARTEVEATAVEIPPLEQAIRQYIHVLSTLLALEPTALSGELTAAAPIPEPPHQVTAGVPSDLLRRRPDIQAAERQIAAATAMVGVSTAQLFPQVVLGAAAGLQSRDWNGLFDGSTTFNSNSYYLTGPSINWTIFDAGRRKAAIRMSEAEVDAAKAYYSNAVLDAFREVESALVAADRTRARVADLKLLVKNAREVATIAQGDYGKGILDQFTVLDAQRQANRADTLLAQGEVAQAVSMVALYKALGGGWEAGEASALPCPVSQIHLKGNSP